MKSKNKAKYPREYRIWKAMRSRCNAPCYKDQSYQIKGIKVCKRWDSFDNFIFDMGECPKNYSIDRINNDSDYTPDNCRWASYKTQALNRGNFNDLYTYNNETHSLKEWAEKLCINYTTLRNRMYYRKKLSFEEAIKFSNKNYYFEGKYYTRKELCMLYKVNPQMFSDRLSAGWSIERALFVPKTKCL